MKSNNKKIVTNMEVSDLERKAFFRPILVCPMYSLKNIFSKIFY